MLTLSIILASILILSTLSWLTVSNKFKMVDWHAKMLIMLYAAVIILIACLSI